MLFDSSLLSTSPLRKQGPKTTGSRWRILNLRDRPRNPVFSEKPGF
jgi:hypothetical protein